MTQQFCIHPNHPFRVIGAEDGKTVAVAFTEEAAMQICIAVNSHDALERAVNADPKTLSMTVVVGGRLSLLDWKYALSEKVLREGMTEAEMLHIAEQIAVKFYERMKREFGIERHAVSAE